MQYNKPALELPAIIEKMEEWGIKITSYAEAKLLLTHVDFFRFKQYYFALKAQFDRGMACHGQKNVLLSDISKLNEFDRKLRVHLIEALEGVELSLKCSVVRHLSLKYGPMGYIDKVPMDSQSRHVDFKRQLEHSIKHRTEQSDPIFKRFNGKYPEVGLPPIWISVEAMSFGMLVKWIKNLKLRCDRRAIAYPFNLDEKILLSFARNLVILRNSCAHNQKIWDRVCGEFKVPMSNDEFSNSVISSTDRLMYNTLAGLCFLNDIVRLDSFWKKRLILMLEEQSIVDLSAMGFPKNWKDLPVWRITRQ